MFRIGVILLVMGGWLFSQLAATPHVHGDSRAHESQPHVHWGGHSHGGHSHSHFHAPPFRSSESKPAGGIGAENDHDDDACYLAGTNTAASIAGEKWTQVQVDGAAIEAIGCELDAMLDLLSVERPPSIDSYGPLRFLVLRTLRI